LLEPEEQHAFTAVSNPKLGLLLVYLFPRQIFPWTSLWCVFPPPPGPDTNARMNLWLLNGQAPLDEQAIEVVVSDFQFEPAE
jgi:hypothetical protein